MDELSAPGAEIVDHRNAVTAVDERVNDIGAYESRAAGDKHVHDAQDGGTEARSIAMTVARCSSGNGPSAVFAGRQEQGTARKEWPTTAMQIGRYSHLQDARSR